MRGRGPGGRAGRGRIDWNVREAGVDIMPKAGTPLPQETIDSVKSSIATLKAPITTPIGTGFRSVNVALRQMFELYACVRPCKSYRGVRSRYQDIDLVLVRENTEDLYAGVEFEKGKPVTGELIDTINRLATDKKIKTARETTGVSIKPISVEGTRADREVRVRLRPRQRPEEGHVRPQGQHHEVHRRPVQGRRRGSGRDYPDIEHEERLVDNMCMQLVQKPELYDVIVLPNLYGDIVSDLCAGLVGGLGVAPGANIGAKRAIFEATHGSAPKYKGLDKVNPTAIILSGMLMLRHLGEKEAAAKLERAVADVIAEGKSVTYDLKPQPQRPLRRRHPSHGRGDYREAAVRDFGLVVRPQVRHNHTGVARHGYRVGPVALLKGC